ncbi:CBS domain-containing protein [Actinomycetospora endophytica]|uniref:CBS domain-containing protein n=1 Tax=Actinomycetospora endophytica TaxID=2291215 RepID=A0ABS8PCX2_9PSEU|nr:CBS domain-containing protein [Actinomycetospora endophytica]MCD2195266.1 CBS domain-containing protein [Actinomycetospora endophytica]
MNVEDPRREVVIMSSRPVQVVHETTTVAEALRLLRHAGVRHLPVVDRGRCVGVLVDVDLVAAAVDGVGGGVGPIARRPVPTVALGADAPTTARAIRVGGMDAALVMDDDVVAGIVTATDVVEALAAREELPATAPAGVPDDRATGDDVRP